MAMFLKLEASTPEATKIQSTPGIPDFMDWNQITSLPWFWQPFHSLAFTIFAIPAVPVLLAFVIGVAMFKRRVGGTYFAIITQAVAAILTILIIGQQGYTGGVNGITDLRTLQGWDIRPDHAKNVLYFVNGGLLIACVLVAQFVRRSKLGRILVAMRDKEDRVRFSGYDVANFKIFVFCLAAGLAAIGGAMFTLQVGFMSPSFVGIVPSIEMVIFCAVGGRTSILGAIYGALTVNWARTTFSEDLPNSGCLRWARCSFWWWWCSRTAWQASTAASSIRSSIACCHRPAAERRRSRRWRAPMHRTDRRIAGARHAIRNRLSARC